MVYICVLNYNNYVDTITCLKSLMNLSTVPYRILLIDNASPNGDGKLLSDFSGEYPDLIKFFQMKNNHGYAAGNNVGLRYALSQEDMDYCWILNNDTVVDSNSLSTLVKYMAENPDIGICGSRLMYEWDRSKLQGYGGIYHYWTGESRYCKRKEDIRNIDFVIGASVFVSRAFLEEIGLMSEDYFLYYEEIDWATRAKGKFKLSCCVGSIVYHKEGASIGTNQKDPRDDSCLSEYFNVRNRILFTRKYYPFHIVTIYLRILGKVYRRIRWHQWNKAWMFVKLLIGRGTEEYEKLLS